MKTTDEARDATLAQAYTAGRNARERGRDLTDCPIYALGQLGQPWRDAWCDGWRSAGPELTTRRK